MGEELLMKWIPSVGFPIAVAVYLLIRIEPRLAAMTTCIEKLISIVEADTKNTRELEKAVQSFTLGINDLKGEIRRFNNNGDRKN